MSKHFPIISLTGASGAGKTVVKNYFHDYFKQNKIPISLVEGDSFHRYNRSVMKMKQLQHKQLGRLLTHYSHHANNLKELEELFETYGKNGTGIRRFYVHSQEESQSLSRYFSMKLEVGELSPKEPLPKNSHLLFYEGLHGASVDDILQFDVAKHVDLKIGVVPIINLEWKQKLHRDTLERGYKAIDVIDSITERLPDYIDYIIPQFSRTNINIQRIPLLDVSNPFDMNDNIENWQKNSVIILHFKDVDATFEGIEQKITNAQRVNQNTLSIPGDKINQAFQLLLNPILEKILKNRLS